MDNNYSLEIQDILSACESSYIEYEDISKFYCYLELARMLKKKAVLVYSDTLHPADLSGCVAYMQRNGVTVSRMIRICFDRKSIDSETVYWKTFVKSLRGFDPDTIVFSYAVYPAAGFIKRNIYRLLAKIGVNADHWGIECKTIRADMPFFRRIGAEIKDYCMNHQEKISDLMNLLADQESRNVLAELIRVSASNDVYRLKQHSMFEKYWDCYRHDSNEIWVNCGSAYGDTILKYLKKGYSFRKIYSFEGNIRTFSELKKIISLLPGEIRRRIRLNNRFIGLEDAQDNFNKLFAKEKVTLINMDIEGAEMGVLRGADEIIRKYRPVLAVCAYHKASDWYEIPRYIMDITRGKCGGEYKFFLRKYVASDPGCFNEYVYYCVPQERCL